MPIDRKAELIQSFYDKAVLWEDTRLLERQLEFDMMLYRLDDYLPTRSRILEIGAASGRYSVELVTRGHNLTAVDLSPQLVALCAKRLGRTGSRRWTALVGDARELLGVGGNYGAALLMGPMYLLTDPIDRDNALHAACNRLVSGGLIFTTWISRFGMIGHLIGNHPYLDRR